MLAPDPKGCWSISSNGAAASPLFDYDPRCCGLHHFTLARSTRSSPGSDERIRRTELLHCCGLERAIGIRHRESYGTHIPNCPGGVPRLGPRPRSTLEHRASGPSAFREVSILCWIETYLLRRARLIEVTCSASIPAEADPSLQNCTGQEQTSLHHCTHMAELGNESLPSWILKQIRRQDKAVYPEWVLHVINQLRHTCEPLNTGLFFASFVRFYNLASFF